MTSELYLTYRWWNSFIQDSREAKIYQTKQPNLNMQMQKYAEIPFLSTFGRQNEEFRPVLSRSRRAGSTSSVLSATSLPAAQPAFKAFGFM